MIDKGYHSAQVNRVHVLIGPIVMAATRGMADRRSSSALARRKRTLRDGAAEAGERGRRMRIPSVHGGRTTRVASHQSPQRRRP